MKYCSLLLALFIGVAVHAQSLNFVKLETKINEYVARSQWDEVLINAPELITEEPTRGEGYYYTALAFSKLGELDKANEYLKEASTLADDKLKIRIETLQADIKKGSEVSKLSETISQSSGTKSSADDFRRLWELDKSRIEHALSAIELYVEKEDYPAALAILNDPVMTKDREARTLADKLNQTPKMKKLNGYNKAMQEGDNNFKKESYQAAIKKYEEALTFFPNDTKAGSAKRKATEELAWQQAGKDNTVESYKKYLAKYPLGTYKSNADDILQRGYLKFAREAVKENDFNKAVEYYKTYQSSYPKGPHISTVNEELCTLYYKEAKKKEKGKEAYDMTKALELYELAGKCGKNDVGKAHLRSLKRKETRWGRDDMHFFGWHASDKMMYGMMAGKLSNRKLAFYAAFRVGEGSDIFESSDAYWETDNENSLTESTEKNKTFNGKVYRPKAFATIGLTKKIVYPLWIYGGAGVAFQSELKEFVNNDTRTTEKVKNKEASYVAVNPEAGLQLRLAFLTLRYGINKPLTPVFKEDFVQHFGVAIKL